MTPNQHSRATASELAEEVREALDYGGARLSAHNALDSLEEQLESLLSLAEHLFQMVPREVWRDLGVDDGQGHYEGDYRAEQIQQELRALRASFPATNSTRTPQNATRVEHAPASIPSQREIFESATESEINGTEAS